MRRKAGKGQSRQSFTIITTAPNAMCATLDPAARDTGALARLLAPYPEAEMRAYPVSQFVNSPRNDGPQCVEAV